MSQPFSRHKRMLLLAPGAVARGAPEEALALKLREAAEHVADPPDRAYQVRLG